MNESITRTDHGLTADTSSPVKEAGPAKNTDFTLSDDQTLEAPAGFEFLEVVGRGGMGLVYRARDLAFDREVALKFLQKKYELGSLHTLRFLDEARITGQLQHPGIPAVHQVGKLPDGRPYLAMKLIKGYTLSEMMWGKHSKKLKDSESPPHVIPKNYLGIFEAICQAVGYAHAHYVIHRDLKPQNIMVGAFGEVQVMDWGLAKVVRPGARDTSTDAVQLRSNPAKLSESMIQTSGSELTTAGSVLGTPSYMSPEQAIGANSQLDTRSDVFGLGAILCTLLTGKPPFQSDTPESTRLLAATGMMSEAFARIDACGVEPDLISLAKRCLSPRRDDRPEHGGAVAEEVARLRTAADERARQAELERTKAEVHAEEQRQRRRVMLLAGIAIISVLLVGIIGTTWGLIHAAAKEAEAIKAADQERDAKVAEAEHREKAQAKEAETQAVLDFVEQKVFSAARPEGQELGLGRNVTLREALISALGSIAEDFKDKPLIEARIRKTLGSSFWYLGDYPTALEQHDRAYQLYVKHLGEFDRLTILAMQSIANLDDQFDRIPEAMKRRETIYQLAEKHYGENDHITLMAMNNLADSFRRLQRYQDAFALREKVLKLASETRGRKDAFTLLCMSNLAQAFSDVGKSKESLALFDETLQLQKQHMGPTHPNTLDTMSQYAATLGHLNRHEEALPLHKTCFELRQEKLGDDHPTTLASMTQLAFCHSCLKQYEDSLKIHQKSLPLYEKRMGPTHEQTLNCLWFIVAVQFDMGRSGDAIAVIDQCLERSNGPKANPNRVNAMYVLRFRHFRQAADLKQCLATVKDWEKRNVALVKDQVDLAKAWAALAAMKQEIEKATGHEEADKALVYLHRAYAAGWSDVKEFEEEKDFDVLRGREEYRLLVEKMKKGIEEKKAGAK